MNEVRDIAPERGNPDSIDADLGRGLWSFSTLHEDLSSGAAAAAILITLGLVAIFAYQLAPHDPLDTSALHFQKPPSRERLLGSDHVGRDALSRIIVGTRTSLYVAFVSVALAKVVGFSWGVLSGYLGGKFDLISQRFPGRAHLIPRGDSRPVAACRPGRRPLHGYHGHSLYRDSRNDQGNQVGRAFRGERWPTSKAPAHWVPPSYAS